MRQNQTVKTKEKPGYYSVTAAQVRYNKQLPTGARLLYGEITALANKYGFCFAGNAYFASLYNRSPRTISRWITALFNLNYINVQYILEPGKHEISQRHIFLIPIKNIKAEIPPEVAPPTAPEVSPEVSPEVVTFLSGGGDKNVADNIKDSNIKTTAAEKENQQENQPAEKIAAAAPEIIKIIKTPKQRAVSEERAGRLKSVAEKVFKLPVTAPAEKLQEDADAVPSAAAAADTAASADIEKLKSSLASLDKRLTFNSAICQKFLLFMKTNNLNSGYPDYIFNLCRRKNPDTSFSGYFLTLFFAENQAAFYAENHKPKTPDAPKEPPKPVSCPVCGTSHLPDVNCPSCLLPHDYNNADLETSKLFYALHPDKRLNYLNQKDAILQKTSNHEINFDQYIKSIKKLNKDFNLC